MHEGVMVGKSLGWVWERELTSDKYGETGKPSMPDYRL